MLVQWVMRPRGPSQLHTRSERRRSVECPGACAAEWTPFTACLLCWHSGLSLHQETSNELGLCPLMCPCRWPGASLRTRRCPGWRRRSALQCTRHVRLGAVRTGQRRPPARLPRASPPAGLPACLLPRTLLARPLAGHGTHAGCPAHCCARRRGAVWLRQGRRLQPAAGARVARLLCTPPLLPLPSRLCPPLCSPLCSPSQQPSPRPHCLPLERVQPPAFRTCAGVALGRAVQAQRDAGERWALTAKRNTTHTAEGAHAPQVLCRRLCCPLR